MTELLLPAIYRREDGAPISTQSMIKTFRRCPKQTEYKYVERLKPRVLSKPLTQGDWMHQLFEAHFKGKNWRKVHKRLTAKFATLFDEERDMLGDLPRECAAIMESYLWHYKRDEWKVHEVEIMLEAELPNGHIFRVKLDLLIENEWGLWIADHKFNAKLPDLATRILDIQSVVYVWAARQMGIPVNGFIWNYVRRKAPTVPKLVYANTKNPRLSKSAIDTTYPVMRDAIDEYGLRRDDYGDMLKRLKAQRYTPGQPQTSTFFRRNVIERDEKVIHRIVMETMRTSERMHAYDYDGAERSPDWMGCKNCAYAKICTLEAFGEEARNMRRQQYVEVDPLYYYEDDPKTDQTRENRE